MKRFRFRKLRRSARWLRVRTSSDALILMYHRVAETDADPWALAVSPDHFAEHMALLRRYAMPLPLSSLVQDLQQGSVARGSVAVTFDDGYADNREVAAPLLERYGIPATFFITTGPLATGQEFWWDQLEGVLLEPGQLPAELSLEIDGKPFHWDLEAATGYSHADAERFRGWRAWEAPPSTRHELFLSLHRALQPLHALQRTLLLTRIADWANRPLPHREEYRVMSAADVAFLSASSASRLIDIGAHTVTHPRLAAQTPDDQELEILQSKDTLERLIGRDVTTFSYPFGHDEDYTEATVSILRQAGFTCACAHGPGHVNPASDPMRLLRLFVADGDGDQFSRLLRNCLRG